VPVRAASTLGPAPVSRAPTFYGIIVGSTVVGTLINFVGVNPIQALFWTAVLNGVLAPPLLVVIMLVANNRAIMGKGVNGRILNALGWTTAVAMLATAAGLFLTWGQV
jgi:Mn2+/Fe2+ NRAMP family transporter